MDITIIPLMYFSIIPGSIGVCALTLSNLLGVDRESIKISLHDPTLLYPLIEGVERDERCKKFLMEYFKMKSECQESCTAEAFRVLRCLQGACGVKSSSKVPFSLTRAFLCQVWAQIPGCVPPHLLRDDKLLHLLFRWLESSPLVSGSDRQYILKIIKSQRKLFNSAIEYNMKILSLFFSGVLRSGNPDREEPEIVYFPDNLQLVLPLLDAETLPICLYAALETVSLGDIISLFRIMNSWSPLSPSKENIHMSKSRFEGSLFPIFPFLNLFIRVAAKVGSSQSQRHATPPDWRVIVETLLRIAASKLAAEKALISDACEFLVYLFKIQIPGRTCQSFLLAGANKCMIPVAESLLSFAETIFNKQSSLLSIEIQANEPLEFLSALIRILQEDIQTAKAGFSAQHSVMSLQLPSAALEVARLSSIGAKPSPHLITASTLPRDSDFLLRPVGPLQTSFLPIASFVAPQSNIYPSGQGLEVEFRTPASLAGIQNFNNTCYLSSFLQALFLTDGFLALIFGFNLQKLGKTEEADFVQGTKVLSGLQLVFTRLLKTHHAFIEISECIRSLPASYRSGEQQDVTESGRWLLDKLGGTEQVLVKSVFGGEMIHKTKCSGCNNVTERKEVFTDLCVSVPKQAEVLGKRKVTVQSLIKKMLKPESLHGDNKYSCETCGKKQDASRWIELTQLPNHLMLVMHRFSFDVAACDFKKETTPVHTDDGTVDLMGTVYELYASILHYGESAMKGHYVTLGKRSGLARDRSQKWALLDDSNVTMMDEPEAAERMTGLHKPTDSAYVMFFRSFQAPSAPLVKIPKNLIDEALAIEAAAVHL